MNAATPDARTIFGQALEIEDAAAREAYLRQACGDLPEVGAEVEALLRAHDRAGGFLDPPAANPRTVDYQPVSEEAGSCIGPYKLREQIGEGGMGVVFVAEQEHPVRRKVALKIIKPGMDTRDVIARFEAERQALALMDHPNIARVLDAGGTDSGRPYFVMELVRGIPITTYCDQNKLTVRERLELFVAVCQAVQHAHQKGIIHRDLKPSNVLVSSHDGKPVPKVIDFGVAKATGQRLTERTIYTRFSQIIGTPLYMSPEQAELSGLDIDTRSDIYSLGVLLYELLTGTTPFDGERLAKAGYDEIRRIVREEEPLKPSTRVSSLGQTATAVSAQRGTDPQGLSRFIRGDLDVIVMKTLEKDRTRRYDTASGLAADVQRFLQDEPILARAPSLAYRFTKFARRNRVAVVTTVLVLASLVSGMVATVWMAQVARNEARRAEEEARRAREAMDILAQEIENKNRTLRMLAESSYQEAVTAALAGDNEKALRALDVADESGMSQGRITVLKCLIALNNGQNEEAIRLADQALADPTPAQGQHIAARAILATACLFGGHDDRSLLERPRVLKMVPETDLDHLFKAYALTFLEPGEALELLKKTRGLKYSPVGLLIRGNIRLSQGSLSGDFKLIDDAIADFEYMGYLFQHNQYSRTWHVLALAVAAEYAKRQGRDTDWARYAKLGRPIAETLLNIKDYPNGDFAAWLFFRAIGDTQAASGIVSRLGQQTNSYCLYAAIDCLRRHDVPSAAEEFNAASANIDPGNKWVRLARAHLVGDGTTRKQEVYGLVLGLINDPSPLVRRYALCALCLVSTPAEIQKLALGAAGPFPNDVFDVDLECLKYLAGEVDEEQLRKHTFDQMYNRVSVYYTLAMMQIAKGNRPAAKCYFRQCIDTNAISFFDYELSRAYLARMDADDMWPQRPQDNPRK